MKEKGDLTDFDVVVGSRQGGPTMTETAALQGFSCIAMSRVYRGLLSIRFLDENPLLMSEVRAEI